MTDQRMPDPDDLVVPDLPEAIVAYREWRVDTQGWLHSPAFPDIPWPVDEPMQARCGEGMVTLPDLDGFHPTGSVAGGPFGAPFIGIATHQGFGGLAAMRAKALPAPPIALHTVPCPHHQTRRHTGHGCGLYGVRAAEEARARWGWGAMHNRHDIVGGEVWLSGQVLEYSEGYRASRATPKALWRPRTGLAAVASSALAADRYGIPLIDGPDEQPAPGGGVVVTTPFALTPVQLARIRHHFGASLISSGQARALFGVGPSRPSNHGNISVHQAPSPRHGNVEALARVRRARARRWAGGYAAAAVLALAGWRRGDLLWWHPTKFLLGLGLSHLAIAGGWLYLAHEWGRTIAVVKAPDR